MNYLRRNRNRIAVIAVMNVVLTIILIYGIFGYVNYRDRSTYEKGISEVQSVAEMSADVTNAYMNSRKLALSNVIRFQNTSNNPMSLGELVEFINSYYASERYQFQILDSNYMGYRATQRAIYGISSFDKSRYELDYSDHSYKVIQEVCDNETAKYKQGSGVCSTRKYTDITTGKECFAYYDTVRVAGEAENEFDYYTLMAIVYGESCTEVMKEYENYNILLSAVVDEDGNYVICDNSVSEHDNLYEEIEDLDDNEIESIKNSLEEKGEGVFVWKDENDRNLVYALNKIQASDWYMVICVDESELALEKSGSGVYVVIVVLLAQFIIDVISLWIFNGKLAATVDREQKANEELRTTQIELEKIREGQAIQIEAFERSIPGGFKITSFDGNIIYVSPKLAETAGYTVAELLQKSKGEMSGLIHPDDVVYCQRKKEECLQNGDTFSIKYRMLRKDGSYIWVVENGKFVLENGELLFYSVVIDNNDVEEKTIELKEANARVSRERRQYREALTRNAEFYFEADITDNAVVPPVMLKGGVSYLDKKGLSLPILFEDMVEIAIQDFGMVVSEEEKRRCWCSKGLTHLFINGVTNAETEYYRPSEDEYRRINILLSEDEDSGHIHAFFICNSTTVQKRKEAAAKKALIDAFEAANRANNAKSDFLSKMSHDIRTPMNAIIGMTAIAEAHIEDRERVSDSLNKIDSASRHLLGLINEVLDMSKIESGKMSLNSEAFNLSEMINNLMVIMQPQIIEHSHEVSVNVEKLEHEKVIGDALRLQQCFVNIMGNAIKYTPDGGKIGLEVREKESKQQNIGCYEFVFSDNGIGMSKDYIEHIFEPFTREEDDRTSKIQGTGLGMTITKSIVTMMDGDIKVESEPGKGSRFTVTVCLKLQETNKVVPDVNMYNSVNARKEAIDEITNFNYENRRVLIVEDNELNMEIAIEIFKMAGMETDTAENGAEAVDKFTEHEENYYDMIFMDIQMPVMNGYEATAAIRAMDRSDAKHVPIVAMTANAFAEDIRDSKRAGMNAHLAKPIDFGHLTDILKRYLGKIDK